jgi:hypothetical protein
MCTLCAGENCPIKWITVKIMQDAARRTNEFGGGLGFGIAAPPDESLRTG